MSASFADADADVVADPVPLMDLRPKSEDAARTSQHATNISSAAHSQEQVGVSGLGSYSWNRTALRTVTPEHRVQGNQMTGVGSVRALRPPLPSLPFSVFQRSVLTSPVLYSMRYEVYVVLSRRLGCPPSIVLTRTEKYIP